MTGIALMVSSTNHDTSLVTETTPSIAIGANLMDGRRRELVLETSLTTSGRRLREQDTILSW